MHIEARFRRRAEVGEDIHILNNKLVSLLSLIEGFWNEPGSIEHIYFDPGNGEAAAADLTPSLVHGFRGAVSYASRLSNAVVDKAISDDSITIEFETKNVDLKWFAWTAFPQLIRAFSPYRAAIVTDMDQDLDDFEEIVHKSEVTGSDVDGRDSVFRIHPVNYFDDILCKRAFGVSAHQVAARLEGSIERIEIIASGVLVHVTSTPVVGASLVTLDEQVRHNLKFAPEP